MSVPRFLLDQGVVANLATVDSSYQQTAMSGRLALFVDYRAGRPMSIQLVRMPCAVTFKVHVALSGTDSA